MNGIEFIKNLKNSECTSEIPIIMCTGVMTTSQNLKTALEAIRGDFINLDVLVGGHAFAYGGTDIFKKYTGINYLESLSQLEDSL